MVGVCFFLLVLDLSGRRGKVERDIEGTKFDTY